MITVAVALAVRCRVAPPELVADADVVKTAVAANPAAMTAVVMTFLDIEFHLLLRVLEASVWEAA
jgi:hypothetical protein